MAGYNLDAIRSKINQLSGNGRTAGSGSAGGEKTKVAWWKPTLGQHDVRFLPYDHNGQPFHEVSYYDSRLLTDRRFVTGVQFGMPDPLFNMLTEMKKDRSKEAWTLWRNLVPKERYYAPILVRGEEEKGVQLWELNSKIVNDVYSVLAHQDYKDENLMDPMSGYDFTVTVSPTDKTFNGNAVKDIKLQPRRKASPLATTPEDSQKIIASIPNFEAYFKSQVKTEEECANMISNFLAGNEVAPSSAETKTSSGLSKEAPEAESVKSKASKKKIDDAFKDL